MEDNTTQSRQEKPQPQGGSFISLDEAAERTKRFRDDYVFKAHDKEERIKGNYFSKEQLLKVLNQPGCEGIRIYNSVRCNIDKDAEGKPVNRRDVIIVAVDKDRDDILKVHPGGGCSPFSLFMAPASGEKLESALILGNPAPCPNICGKSNDLNGGQ